jgi:murein L,D-transpeptidase YcbB/YkuD
MTDDALTWSRTVQFYLDMSNTGRRKKLASFNCDQKMWEQFIANCQSKGTTATATLTRFIELYLDSSLDDLDAIAGHDLDKTLDSRIKASIEEYLAASQSSSDNPTNQTILAICERLSELESQREGEFNSNETTSSKPLTDLDEKIEGITSRMTQLAEAIMKIQNYLNNQPRQRNKSYNNNSYHQRSTPRIQPLTEEGLAARLGVNAETIHSERVNLPSPLFVAWCKSKDRAGLGWEFNQNTGLYHPVS